MTKIQFLLFFLVILPFTSAALFCLIKNYKNLAYKANLVLSLVFLVNSFGLLINFLINHREKLNLLNMNGDIVIGLTIDPISLIFLMLTALIWPLLNCYNQRFFNLSKDDRNIAFEIFFCLNFGFIILIILSKNLVSMFMFYQSLIFCMYFFNTYFMSRNNVKTSYNFTFILFAGSILFLIAIILTYKITGNVEFSSKNLINDPLSSQNSFLLFCLYLIGIALPVFAPFYLLYGNLYYLNSPVIISVFILSYGMIALFMILKIIIYIFGITAFISYNQNNYYIYFLVLILISNLLACGILTITGRNLKQILIYLFFNQLIMVILSFLIFQNDIHKILISIFSFVLTQILIFICVGNFNLLIMNSKDKSLNGALYKLKITSILFIFALLNIVGFVPSIGLVEKYLLIKQIIKNHYLIFGIAVLLNIILNFVCIIKIIYPIIRASQIYSKSVIDESAKIEQNRFLIIPAISKIGRAHV